MAIRGLTGTLGMKNLKKSCISGAVGCRLILNWNAQMEIPGHSVVIVQESRMIAGSLC